MATNATIGVGCTLGVDINADATYTTIVELTSIRGPSASRGEANVTELSTADEKYLPGTLGYTASFEGWWAPDKHGTAVADADIISLIDSGAVKNWKITWNDTTPSSVVFPGFMTTLEPSVNGPGEACSISGTIRISDSSLVVFTFA